jgi:hypothetical protein
MESYGTSSGKRYRVRYRRPDQTQTDLRGFKTERAAEVFTASTELSHARGEYIDVRATRATRATRAKIDEFGVQWLASQTHLKSSAFEPIEITWRLYVKPR